MNSTSKVEVIRINGVEKHPNADALEIIEVWGYKCVSRIGQFKPGDLCCYIPPDNLVDTERSEFSFLNKGKKYERIKAKKLRGYWSQGLLLEAPPGSVEGQDVAELLGVKHYEIPIQNEKVGGGIKLGGDTCHGPELPKYDLESWRRYPDVFVEGEPVHVTEKVHGANARYFSNINDFFCGSRTQWKREYPSYDHLKLEDLIPKVGEERAKEIIDRVKSGPKVKSPWWQALDHHPEVREFCLRNPNIAVYGELYGSVQYLKYGVPSGQVRLAVFDLFEVGKGFMSSLDARSKAPELPWVPTIFMGAYQHDLMEGYAEGQSLYPNAGHIREGCVIKTLMTERWHEKLGRVALKLVSNAYLSKDQPEIAE